MESWTSTAVSNVSGSYCCTLLLDLHGSGRRELAVRRWQKPITANTNLEQPKTLVWNPFLWGEQKKNKAQAKVLLAADQPQSVSPYKALCSVVRCSKSHTARCHRPEKNKNKKILLFLFLWLDLSSSSNTEIFCKYHPKHIQAKGAKNASPKVSFSRYYATSHTSSMHLCWKVPRRPRPAPFCEQPPLNIGCDARCCHGEQKGRIDIVFFAKVHCGER